MTSSSCETSDELFPPDAPVSRADSRRLLAGLAALHLAGEHEPDQQLCPIAGRSHENDAGFGWRIESVKRSYDPANLFRVNWNIKP